MLNDHFLNLFFIVGIIGVIVYLKFMNNKTKPKTDFQKVYMKILNSEQYKVKGRYD